jgi:hypothetical protein
MRLAAALMFEVMDKEWSLLSMFSLFIGLGVIGFFVCKRWPLLWLLFIPLLSVFAVGRVMEFMDPYLGEAIRQEAGLTYVIAAYVFMVVGLLLPIAGSYLGRSKHRKAAPLPR